MSVRACSARAAPIAVSTFFTSSGGGNTAFGNACITARNLLQSITYLAAACRAFATRCVDGITANVDRMLRYAEQLGLVNPPRTGGGTAGFCSTRVTRPLESAAISTEPISAVPTSTANDYLKFLPSLNIANIVRDGEILEGDGHEVHQAESGDDQSARS